MELDLGRAYSTLKKMGARPGDIMDNGSFTLINNLETNLTNEESVEKIANYFALISQEYPLFNRDNLPQRVKSKLNTKVDEMNIPKLEEYQVHEMINKAKRPKS